MEDWLVWAIPRYEVFIAAHPDHSPSVSRFGDEGHYEVGNIEIIAERENKLRQKSPSALRPDGTKICGRCHESKMVEHFSKRAANKDGFDYWCRDCKKVQNKLYRTDQ